ncbi:MAG: hypothetical protein CENE_01334 [Candidatus Celerinatantimonas neptuna]|nr:MAG: hypothetical protein CENE_01334 [Candidatus Celerinatantimonas neptuna]
MSTRTNTNLQLDAYIRELLESCAELTQKNSVQTLERWLHHEQHGYPYEMPLPSYRLLECSQQGLFTDHDSKIQRLESIHAGTLSARDRCQLQYIGMREPLYDYLEISQVIRHPWPEKLIQQYTHELIPGMICLQAWQVIDNPPVSRMLAGMLQHLYGLLTSSGDELFSHFNPTICKLGEHYPLVKPFWQSRPHHHQAHYMQYND